MGQIAATYDIMPESIDIPTENILKGIDSINIEGVRIIDVKKEPVAFGLMKVVIGVIINDSIDSIGTSFETELKAIEGVENIECTSSALL